MLYLFSGVDDLPAAFPADCSTFLPRWRQEQVNGYRFPADRRLSGVAYLLLVYALKHEGHFHALPEFGYHAGGKPFLQNYPGIFFNLSHCPGTVACALSDAEVGVDVERVTAYDDELARRVCSPLEYAWISGFRDADEQAVQFTLLWTRKESVIKYRGTGLAEGLKDIPSGLPDRPDHPIIIHSHTFPAEGFCLSLCRGSSLARYHEDEILSAVVQPAGDLLRMGERPFAHAV